MAVSSVYVEHIVQTFLPFAGKEVPDNLVETWEALDSEVKEAVRVRLRTLLTKPNKTTSGDHHGQKRGVSVEPKAFLKPHTKQAKLVAILQSPGWHSVNALSKTLNSSSGSVYGMLNRCLTANYPIKKLTNKEGIVLYRLGPEAPVTTQPSTLNLLGEAESAPLSRGERGALGAIAARGKYRMPHGAMEEISLRVLEQAGENGLTVDEWASALNSTPGGMYRRITTLRRRGHAIGMRRGDHLEKNRYFWQGKQSTQESMFGELDPSKLMSLKEVAELFGVHKNTINVWVKQGLMPRPELFTKGGQMLSGWRDSVIEKFLDKPPNHRICPHCGESFKAVGSKVYCSENCRNIARPADPVADTPVAVSEAVSEAVVEAATDEHTETAPTSALPRDTEIQTLWLRRAPAVEIAGWAMAALGTNRVGEITSAMSRAYKQATNKEIDVQEDTTPSFESLDSIVTNLVDMRSDLLHHHEMMMKYMDALKGEKNSDRFPEISALYALDQHLSHGFNADRIIAELREGSDASTIRDWLWKLQGRVKRLAQAAST